jgi:DNA-binding MarR family transcriptional regulator
VVAKLEENGLVRRSTCPGNGRVVLASLTDAGHREIVAMAPRHVDVVRDLVIDTLDADQLDQLAAICARMLSAVDREPPVPRR